MCSVFKIRPNPEKNVYLVTFHIALYFWVLIYPYRVNIFARRLENSLIHNETKQKTIFHEWIVSFEYTMFCFMYQQLTFFQKHDIAYLNLRYV
jgi:hypothetical protein